MRGHWGTVTQPTGPIPVANISHFACPFPANMAQGADGARRQHRHSCSLRGASATPGPSPGVLTCPWHSPRAQAGIPPGTQLLWSNKFSFHGQQPQSSFLPRDPSEQGHRAPCAQQPPPKGSIPAGGQGTGLPPFTGHVNPSSAQPCRTSDNE